PLAQPVGRAVAGSDGFQRHEPDIVPVVRVPVARVAEPDEELHVRLDGPGIRKAQASGATVGGTIEQTVKSRSVMVGVTPCGRVTSLMCTVSPMSRPVRSTSMTSGIASAGACTSIARRTMLSVPPTLRP